jgi:hypothetical protein
MNTGKLHHVHGTQWILPEAQKPIDAIKIQYRGLLDFGFLHVPTAKTAFEPGAG